MPIYAKDQEFGRLYNNPLSEVGPIEVVHSARVSKPGPLELARINHDIRRMALLDSWVDTEPLEATMVEEQVDYLANPRDDEKVEKTAADIMNAEEGGVLREILLHARLPYNNRVAPQEQPILAVAKIAFLDERPKSAKNLRPEQWQHVVRLSGVYVPKKLVRYNKQLRNSGIARSMLDCGLRGLPTYMPLAMIESPRFVPGVINWAERHGFEPVANKSKTQPYLGEQDVPMIYYRHPSLGGFRLGLQDKLGEGEMNYLKYSVRLEQGS